MARRRGLTRAAAVAAVLCMSGGCGVDSDDSWLADRATACLLSDQTSFDRPPEELRTLGAANQILGSGSTARLAVTVSDDLREQIESFDDGSGYPGAVLHLSFLAPGNVEIALERLVFPVNREQTAVVYRPFDGLQPAVEQPLISGTDILDRGELNCRVTAVDFYSSCCPDGGQIATITEPIQ
jgi:hypothetical protein